MESKVSTSGKRRKNNEAGLLPYCFKKLGIAVMVFAFVPAVVVKAGNIQIAPASNHVFRILTMNAFILGLLFVAWAKDKVEDELTVVIRLKAIGFSFISAVLVVVIKPFINMLFNDPVADFKSQELVLSMLVVYLLMYYSQKKAR
jgi:membrane protease YdiL (CAAX protease family)